ncbi:hypothetical protein FHX42_003373 [Saccharopolyspora lacisalsi]|uniref:Uncharacterized protein n=1 Tax=Halosaccharopolyspora lacisalsi TaxID=1000566 RepID=A0A839E2M7_9PSEU|nr:hypothetical protein [Halosaccharopolyspora lacisalsi]MBA8826007.1 hypothetical protein [Halosaccharopolyspora lacisalsi]
MSETQDDSDRTGSWQRLSEALSAVAAAWREAGASQIHPAPEDTSAIHQLRRSQAQELARTGYEAAEALTGLATVLAGQEGAAQVWETAHQSQRESWRRWRVAMDAEVPDENTPP